ncbi:MAG: hypothetical protein L0J08_09930 [Micrococcaceae bacterium]|nr:hypothetical protein [Micrococcaceae bacterium]
MSQYTSINDPSATRRASSNRADTGPPPTEIAPSPGSGPAPPVACEATGWCPSSVETKPANGTPSTPATA